MRRLLMIAYHFPPVGGVGVERSLKHAAFLPEHGWQAAVVAPSHSAYRIVDPASVERLPPWLEVHRAPTLEPAHLRRAIGSLVRRGRAADTGPTPSGPPTPTPARSTQSLTAALRGRANRAWATVVPRVFFPDDQLLWVPPVVVAGLLAHRRAAVDAVYSSSPPVSGHLAAAVLADLLDVPWIADWRDAWVGNAFVRDMPALHRRIRRDMERALVMRADRSVFPTGAWRDRYARRYPRLQDRFVHIANGYDRADLGDRAERQAGAPFRLIYAGSVYGDRELDIFLDGVALALDRDQRLRDLLRIEFIGWLSAPNQVIAAGKGATLAPVVSFGAQRRRPEVLDLERMADAGLIVIADDPGRGADVNAKLYEYIGLDLPVLAVAPPGEARSIVDQLAWGVGVDPTPERVAEGLSAIMRWQRPERRADPDGLYDRRRLAAQLAGLLDEL
jgi:hypothetical protein